MDVYLVPVGGDRHELYFEVVDDPSEPQESAAPARGLFRRLGDRFRDMLAEAERERREGRAASTEGGWRSRLKAKSMRWVAENIAEQRLLWHLRSCTEACLFYPDDLDESRAVQLLRARLAHDFDRHRFWMAIDALGFIASGALTLLPGPNLVAYYFAFRLVGHYLSLRGARQGLSRIVWRTEKSSPLADLRRAIYLAPEIRVRRVHDVALQLRLEHLATFFERTAIP